MAILFDKTLKLITVEDPATTVTIQVLYDAISDWSDNPENMEVEKIANVSGKEDLGGGVKVGITLELINDWRLQFEARGAPPEVSCTVSGGNLVAVNSYSNNPISATANTQVTIAQSSSATFTDKNFMTLTQFLAFQ